MTREDTITLTRRQYDALIERNYQLEDILVARDSDNGVRVSHEVALDIMRGMCPMLALRRHLRISLKELSVRTGLTEEYISEIERGLKPGSTSDLARIAGALNATIDTSLSRPVPPCEPSARKCRSR